MKMPSSLRSAAPALALLGLGAALLVPATPAFAQYRQTIANNPALCRGEGPAVLINVSAIKSGEGTLRVQLYRGTAQDWPESGRWLKRNEMPARALSTTVLLTICVPCASPVTTMPRSGPKTRLLNTVTSLELSMRMPSASAALAMMQLCTAE